jgi:hypothetical protein
MKKYKIFAVAMIAAVTFTSCLKDDDPIISGAPSVLEFKALGAVEGTADTIQAYALPFEATATSEVINVVVRYTGPDKAPSDLAVKLELDQRIIEAYNEENETEYELLPADLYDVPSLDIVIPKGQNSVTVPFTVNPSAFDLSKSYVLPLKIVPPAGQLAGRNNSAILVNVLAKNEYDGLYRHTYVSSLGSGTNTVPLITTGKNSVKSSGLLGVYSNAFAMNIDPETNQVTVIMDSLLPVATDASSKYDPASRTFTIKWTSNGGARTFEETFVHISSR